MGNFYVSTTRDLNRLKYIYPTFVKTADRRKIYPFIHQQPRFETTYIPDCMVWYRADAGVVSSGADVSFWADQSGTGMDLTVGHASLSDSGGISFDGAADYLIGNGGPVQFFQNGNSDTFLRVAYTRDNVYYGVFMDCTQQGGSFNIHGPGFHRNAYFTTNKINPFMLGDNSTGPVWDLDAIPANDGTPGSTNTTTFELRTYNPYQPNPNVVYMLANGVSGFNNDSVHHLPQQGNIGQVVFGAQPHVSTPLTVLAGTFMKCIIYEAVVFARVLSDAERSIVMAWISRWG
jgi:hypothetical protein